MKVEKIEADLIEWLPTCEGAVIGATKTWRLRQGQSPVCTFPAHFRIDGVPMCERHAGKALLAEAIEKGTI